MKSQYPIGLHINKLSRLISRKVDAAVLSAIDDNITVSQAYVIDFITDNNDRDVFQKDLEMEFDLKRSSVSLMLNNMEKHDLIKRVPVAEDARLKKIILTEKYFRIFSPKVNTRINHKNQFAKLVKQTKIELKYENNLHKSTNKYKI